VFDSLVQDLRYAARRFQQGIGSSATVIGTLALGVGATTAIFSVVYGVLLRPLPYPSPDRLVAVWEVNHRGTHSRLADPNFADFRDQSRTFEGMAKYSAFISSVSGRSEPTRTVAAVVSRDFFTVLGVRPMLGRSFLPEDARIGAAPVLLASARYWRDHLESSRDLSAMKLRIRGRVYSVVGVLPETFEFPAKAELWIPSELDAENTSRTSHNYSAIGRLKPSVTVAEAAADLAALAARIVSQSAERNDYLMRSATAVPLQESVTGRIRGPLLVLFGAVGVLLLVACANAANLLLAQASARARELAVRSALGAGRGRLVRQFVVEALLLSGASAVLGVAVAFGLLRVLLALAPPELPRLAEVTVNGAVLGFAGGIAALVAVGLGVLTALRATSGAPRATLVEGGRGTVGTERSRRVGRALVAAQVAMTLTLLTGAGLLGRSLQQVLLVDPGFRIEHVIAADVALPESGGDEESAEAETARRARASQLLGTLVARLHSIPGLEHAAAVNAVPMGGGLPDGMFLLVSPSENPQSFEEYGRLAAQPERRGTADFCAASAEYFQALGIPLRRGRLFDERDGFESPHVALVNESLARVRWPGQNPLGQTVQFGNMDGDLHLLTIVGVVGDTREYGPEQPSRPTLYVNILQRPRADFSIVMHTAADPGQVIAASRAILRTELPEVAPRFRTFSEIYSASLGPRRFNLILVGVFAVTALLLAIAGIYGVVSYAVAQRTKEIGVRMALGAQPPAVVALVLRQGLATTLAGVGAGLIGSLLAAYGIRSLLFGVVPADPLTFAGVVLLLVAVATVACYLPARRATRVDPISALRSE
jgi:predicted permease